MENDDLIREIEKIRHVLALADRHFTAEAQMNAALHMSDTVRPAPLAAAVGTALNSAARLVAILKETPE